MDTCPHITGQILYSPSIPVLGSTRLRSRNEFPPQNTQLKADPCDSERRRIAVFPQRMLIDPVGFVELTKVSVQRSQWHQILQASGLRSHPASGFKRSFQIGSAGLVDA